MKNYNQLNFSQRYSIESLLLSGKSKNDIAESLGVHVSTIHQEVAETEMKEADYIELS